MKKSTIFLRVCATLVVALCLFTLTLTTTHAQTLSGKKGTVSSGKTIPNYIPPEPDCYGSGCYNKDPFQTKCGVNGQPAHSGNVVSYTSAYIPSNSTGGVDGYLGVIYNYYSSFCNANWAEVTMYQDPGRAVLIDIDTTDANGHYEKQCEPTNCTSGYTGTSYPAWTNMIDGTKVTTACAHVSNGDGSREDCVSQ